jgi:uncharacterized membrane protein
MKNRYRIVTFLAVIPFIVSCMVLNFLPEQVPLHYTFAGEINRWGSKYQVLIVPVMIIGIGFLLLLAAKHYGSKKEEYTNEKGLLYVSNILMIFLNLFCYYFLYITFLNTQQEVIGPVNNAQIPFIGVGLLLVILGNIFPKVKMNSVFGVRTKWSMENEQTWFKSQRFGGGCFVSAGFVVIVANVIPNNSVGAIVALAAIGVATVGSIIASYKYYLMYRK